MTLHICYSHTDPLSEFGAVGPLQYHHNGCLTCRTASRETPDGLPEDENISRDKCSDHVGNCDPPGAGNESIIS